MKKIILGLMLLICLTACEVQTVKHTEPMKTELHDIEWDGHTYIVLMSDWGGASIIHSESCECNKNKED